MSTLCFEYNTELNFGTPKIINFPFGTNGKLIILDVPILMPIKVNNSVSV